MDIGLKSGAVLRDVTMYVIRGGYLVNYLTLDDIKERDNLIFKSKGEMIETTQVFYLSEKDENVGKNGSRLLVTNDNVYRMLE